MNKLKKSGTVMFMGSSQKVLDLIVKRASVDYPHLKVVTYSPPYKPEFSDEDNKAIIDAINAANPDLLWIGMTAPKQEKWTYSHWNELSIHCLVGTIRESNKLLNLMSVEHPLSCGYHRCCLRLFCRYRRACTYLVAGAWFGMALSLD